MVIIVAILLILSILSIAYFWIYATLVDMNNPFTWFWLILGVISVLAGSILIWMHLHNKTVPKVFSRGIGIVVGLGLLCFLIVEGIIISYGASSPGSGADYVIVLGARIKGKRITANLSRRLMAANEYLQDNPETKVILSGGQGSGEDISEAEAMAAYLKEKGIAQERFILEKRSVNTYENIKYSLEKMDNSDAKVVLVTNDFHVFRGIRIARKQGMNHVQGLGAPTKWYTVPNMYVREGFAVIKYALFGQI